ncbi:MAG TPA: hypothetical protein VFA06_23985 [Actinocrinis sp.]|uniref:hypothetical protein n=1 Tax=Actinocrinis sp. TaxID=1920516 RepID=UPI002D6D606F|nr:hypothetical protein [Actinocrinis sp.]HZU58963.1 hypothetical protein [Actinocrinis sp.]
MFDVEERQRVRGQLLTAAKEDPGIAAAAVTGSEALNAADQWSDIDLAFSVRDRLDDALRRWTTRLYQDFAAVHHWDLTSGPAIYRVFLLPGWLEVDLAFTAEAEFRPRGPAWRTVFGDAQKPAYGQLPDREHLAGLAWHHALHAHTCIERQRWWQAEYWISALRDQIIALACLRLGRPTAYAKGAHLLPLELTKPLEATLVRSLDEAELRRALNAAALSMSAELDRTDPLLAARLNPMLTALTTTP